MPEAGPAAQFQSLFEQEVRRIVVHIMPRASALAVLQNSGRRALPSADQQQAFVEYGLDRLSHLTLGDAGWHGLTPAQYEIWRRQYFHVPATPVVPAPPAPSVTSVEPPAVSVAEVDSKRRRPVAHAVAQDAASPEAAVAAAVVDALKPVVDSVARPANRSALPSLGTLPAVVGKLVAASLGASASVADVGRQEAQASGTPVAQDASSPEADVAAAVVGALKPVVDSVAQPAKQAATPSLGTLPAVVAKLVAASLGAAAPGRTNAKSLTVVASIVAGLLVNIRHLIDCPAWAIATILATGGAGAAYAIWRRQRPPPATGDQPSTDRPATATPTASRRRAYRMTAGIGGIALAIAGTI